MSATPHPIPPTHSINSDAEIIEQLKRQLDMASKQLDSTTNELQYAKLKIQILEERLRLQRIAKYGAGSEKLSNAQLELLELEPGVSHLEVAAESEREAPPSGSEQEEKEEDKNQKKRKHPGRQTLPANLERVERVLSCTPEQCVCGSCGAGTTVIGYEESEQLDVEPARYFVLVTRREKRACKSCEEQGVAAAPLPERIIDKSLVSDRVILDVIVGKYADHTPLYRQSGIMLRDAGINISCATMCGWVMTIGDMLGPVVAAMRRELLAGRYIQADETPVDVQTHDGRGRQHQAYLWQYGTPGGAAVFEFRMGRGREGPARFLGNFEGILQTDDYAAYDRVGGPKMVHGACWSHARRRFVEAVKLNPQDVAAVRMVALMDRLFVVDARARDQNMDHAARHRLRQQQAPPLLDQIRDQILAMSKSVLPQSAPGKACSYALALWQKLTRFLDYPELELSNNLAENSMRPVAVGRKNWIHIGSEPAGPRVAAILSVVESCRRLKIPVRDYLANILPGLANKSIQRVADLTPTAWAAQHR